MPRNFLLNLLLISLSLSCTALKSDDAPSPFTVIVLPDTQNYVKYDGAEKKFMAQIRWIKENRDALNIKFAIHEGDITDNNSPEQWEKVKKCMEVLDGFVPYAVCVGNHDIGYKGPAKSPICEYFKETDFQNKPWWGGKMSGQNCFWYKFESGKDKYVILSLDLGPSDQMLEWADKIIEANKDCKVIMVTHEYLNSEGGLSDKATKKNSTAYGRHDDGSIRNTGREVWEKHVKKHAGYFMVLCGHYEGPGSRNSMKGDNGNTIHQIMANYQYTDGGGNGYLRIMKFDPANNKCHVQTYSPYLDKFWKDDVNDFTLDLDSN